MTSRTSLLLGGRYQLEERLAVGGMGEVWCANDTVLGRAVAVKVLREEYAGDPAFRGRFRAEAQHSAVLVHPNIAQVFDFSEGDEAANEPPYLVMELIRGEPLSTILEREAPLSADRTWSILGQVASALSAAHAAGIVHRDVKPANLLICPDGAVKVTDFGIARATDAAAVTTTGQLLGTPHYISPEQVSGDTVSAASDFYALGAVGYECLTGMRLYDGDQMSVLVAHRDAPAPPLPESVPAGLRELITGLLSKDPAERPTDGRAIAEQAERMVARTIAMQALVEPFPAEPAARAAAAAAAPSTGVLTPPGVGPNAAPAEGLAAERRRPMGMVWGAAVVALLLVAIGIAVATRGSSGGSGPSISAGTSTAVPIKVASVSAFADGGHAPDHPEEAALAADGKAATAWMSQHYATASFGSLRSGTGLVFDLGRAASVKTLQLRLAFAGVSASVYAGNSESSLLSSRVVARSTSAPTSWTVSPGVSARYWLVWFTKLAPSDGAYRAGIAEAVFRG